MYEQRDTTYATNDEKKNDRFIFFIFSLLNFFSLFALTIFFSNNPDKMPLTVGD